MRKLRNILAIGAVAILFSSIDVNAQTYRTAGFAADAPAMERQILKKLVSLPRYGVFDHITFQLNDGTVTLGGKVQSLGTRGHAEKAVGEIPGVVEVINNIEELPPSPSDNAIRIEALRKFFNSGLGPYFPEYDPPVRIIVDRGRITLEGYVNGRGDSNMLNILANGVDGVFEVTNNLIVGKDSRR